MNTNSQRDKSIDEAIRIITGGGVLSDANGYFYVSTVIRRLMGINTRRLQSTLSFEQHEYYAMPDGRYIDLDYNSQSARLITTQRFEDVCAKRTQRCKEDLQNLQANGHLCITDATITQSEIVAALSAVHVETDGGGGSDSHCSWKMDRYSLPDGRTLVTGNGPDEGWSSATITATALTGYFRSKIFPPANLS